MPLAPCVITPYSVKSTVLILSLVQLAMVSIGVAFYLMHTSAAVVFYSFALLMVVYYRKIPRMQTKEPTNELGVVK